MIPMINRNDSLLHLFNAIQRDNVKHAVAVKEAARYKKEFKKGERLNLSELTEVIITNHSIVQYKRKMPQLCHVRVDGYDGRIFLYKNDVVGFINVDISDGCIQALDVSEKYRGRGIGSQLLSYAIIRLCANSLSVNKSNEVAIRLYKKYNFYIEDEDGDMYYMERG